MSFQKAVYLGIPMGWAGDVASINPHATLVSRDGGLQSGKGGIYAGRFVWFDPDDTEQKHVINSGTSAPLGFVVRDLTGVTERFDQEASMLISEGRMVSVWQTGDFVIQLPEDAVPVAYGGFVFVDPKTGEIVNESVSGAVQTKFKYLFNANGGEAVKISSFI